MGKYKYINATVTHVSLKIDSKLQEFSFHNGIEYDLDGNNEFIRLLVKQKKLILIDRIQSATKEIKKKINEQS